MGPQYTHAREKEFGDFLANCSNCYPS
jgi:hypothetical protein